MKKYQLIVVGGGPGGYTAAFRAAELGMSVAIVDDNDLKQGLFTPITHIPILPPSVLYERKPDYLLILAWNFSDQIMKINKRYSDEVGRFILPMPSPSIVL